MSPSAQSGQSSTRVRPKAGRALLAWTGLPLALGVALGCAPPPPAGTGGGEQAAPTPAPHPAELGPMPAPDQDPLLASARARMQQGRVDASSYERLLASGQGDHRHALRLLQSVAGDTPAAVIERSSLADPQAPTGSSTSTEPSPPPAALEPAEREPPQPDAAVLEVLTLDPPQDPRPVEYSLWADEEHLLLSAPSPPQSPLASSLVILTRLVVGESPDGGHFLDIAGSGPFDVQLQPLASHHVRLWVLGAGAVPAFLEARPSTQEVAVVAVRREGPALSVEIELALAWSLSGSTPRDKGLRLHFKPDSSSL